MSVADLQELEEVKLLVVKGQATGVLTYAEVATALAEVELDEGDIEELHGYFEKSEIELVEDDPTHSEPQVERAVDRRSRRTRDRYSQGVSFVSQGAQTSATAPPGQGGLACHRPTGGRRASRRQTTSATATPRTRPA